MKLNREKLIRQSFVLNNIDFITNLMLKTVIEQNYSKFTRKSYRNICQETGRTRGIIRDYKISRLVFRSLSDKGQIEGIRRASW